MLHKYLFRYLCARANVFGPRRDLFSLLNFVESNYHANMRMRVDAVEAQLHNTHTEIPALAWLVVRGLCAVYVVWPALAVH